VPLLQSLLFLLLSYATNMSLLTELKTVCVVSEVGAYGAPPWKRVDNISRNAAK
jgi:hypothetical protein